MGLSIFALQSVNNLKTTPYVHGARQRYDRNGNSSTYSQNKKRGFPPTVPLVEIINAILYKLKTGVQWHQLPVKALFEQRVITWNAVYYHYRKWCLSDTLKHCWITFLKSHKKRVRIFQVWTWMEVIH